MIEIALCDDNAEDIKAIETFAERLASEHSDFSMRLSSFASAERLLEHLENNSGFDLYILDVVMPEMTGIQLAEKIRRRGERAEIVFLTFSRDYAVDAFSVSASGYLLKPVQKESFDETVLKAVRKLINEKSAALTVKIKDGMRRIPLHKIVMVESFNHMREITMTDGSVLITPATLSEMFGQMQGRENFYVPHRAYIANLDHSVGIVRYDLLMIGNRRIPIPKKQFVAVQEAFRTYFFRRKEG